MKNKISLICLIILSATGRVESQAPINAADVNFSYKNMPGVLPGTKPLTWEGDLSAKMMDRAQQFIDEKINESIAGRSKFWNRDFSSTKAYELSVEPNRKRLMKYIGVEDKTEPSINFNVGLEDKNPPVYLEKISVDNNSELVSETSKYRIYQVRWPVLNRVYAEGLLLQPKTKPLANIIAMPDADQTTEELVG